MISPIGQTLLMGFIWMALYVAAPLPAFGMDDPPRMEHEQTEPISFPNETITHYEPFVAYGSRITPMPKPWYKKPWLWGLLVGIIAVGLEAEGDDSAPSCPPVGSLVVTGPAL